MKPSTPPTGRKIVLELVSEMEARLYPLLYRTLAPGVYHVYLHPDDFREVEAVTPLIVLDAQQALNARVEELNRRSKWRAFLANAQAQIEIPRNGWEIYLHPDANGELEPGALGIVSRMSLPAQPRFDGGTPTTRIVRTVVTGTIRRSAAGAESDASPAAPMQPPATAAPSVPPPSPLPLPVPLPPPSPAPAPVAVAALPDRSGGALPATAERSAYVPAATATAQRPANVAATEIVSGAGFARLAYVDDQGPHVFVMRKDLVSIGRGGSAHWVDVQVASTPRVSREHCRIRRDVNGRFFLQDISTWGTSVDGQPIAPFLRQTGDRVEETGQERELPRQARIQLADAVIIEFEAQLPR